MGELKKWRDQNWVRIGADGSIKGPCGTSKDKKNPDRCLPESKAKSLTKGQRKATAAKKKRAGSKGQQVVKNTKAATVKNMSRGGDPSVTKAKRPFRGNTSPGSVVARGCGKVLTSRRKQTKGSVA
jgi:hypothetical protein|tara:strand:- start:197 stop:574 length:378 start_codon:yes stop_codon:yes gene_type:complete